MSAEIDFENASGGELRQKLEEALADNQKMAGQITEFTASQVVSEGGFDRVSAEDLAGVSPDEMASKAAELQEQRAEDERRVARDLLSRQGLEGDALNEALVNLVGDPGSQVDGETQQSFERVSALGGGTAVPAVNPADLDPKAKIAAGIAQREARRKK